MNIKKFRQYASFKGNVTFLFILILITTSTIALLAMSQIRNLQRYGNTSFEYLKTYYLSKAWMELALMEVNSRWYGFNFTTSTGDQFIKKNFPFVWFEEGEETPDKYFQYRIIGRSPIFWEDIETESCQENPRSLNPWETLVIPLFYDKEAENSHRENLSWGITYQDNHNLLETLQWLDSAAINLDHLYTLFSYNSGTMQSVLMNTWSFKTWESTKIEKLFESPTSDSKYYFTIKNIDVNSRKFCLKDDRRNSPAHWITLPFVTIHVLAKYKDTELEDHLIYSKGYPEYLLWLS